jgi:hypothetical protein
MSFLLLLQVCLPSFSSFGLIKLILTHIATFVEHPTLPVTWSTSIMSNVISITVTSMCSEFQLIWSTGTHSVLSCYFCGSSSTSSNLVHKLKSCSISITLSNIYTKFSFFWINRTYSHTFIQTVTVFKNSNFHEKITKRYLIYFCD